VLAARNRYFRIAASAAAVGWLLLAVLGIIDAVHIFGETVRGGYTASYVLVVVADLVAIFGWLLVAAAFGREVDWWRLRLGAVIVATAYAVYFIGWIAHLLAVFADTHDGDYRGYYLAGGIGALLFAVGAFVVAAGLGEGQRGTPRASRLWLGAILVVVASVATAAGELYLQSFYSANHAVHEATIGTLVTAVGAFLTAVAGVVFVRRAKRPFAAREVAVAAAGAVAVVATVVIAAGEALIALAYSHHGGLGWQQVVSWLAVASRLFVVAGFTALALGAHKVRGGSVLDAGGAA
jgi:hypothetical protein